MEVETIKSAPDMTLRTSLQNTLKVFRASAKIQGQAARSVLVITRDLALTSG
ncbi:hypothetical protein KIN20_034154 [Parelaphostrongylus tenuis]|uniref:Uncharacterized protein n=1 Tax=Parelaphostrongylus tenuis TaxID=148309 RepID=A0AAD5R9W0_PARTN|nr:hypothetical protein KIN20_034154 [Parelaphostrongylus tenuis]